MKLPLTQEMVRSFLDYDPETGIFLWKKRVAAKVFPGTVAGCFDSQGYWRLQVGGHLMKAHRVAWLHFYGAMPEGEIDHINGKRADNRIANLRLANRSINTQNTAMRAANTSGYMGVSFYRPSGTWTAQISVNGKKTYLGRYSTPQEAHEVYIKAKREMHIGFNEHRPVTAAHHGIVGKEGA